MIDLPQPLISLQKGHWFKLICGASLHHLPAVRNLTLAYTLAGADCIDVAADPAVIRVVREALSTAKSLSSTGGQSVQDIPWLMVSLNDAEDPHFRKAELRPADCLAGCPQPCVTICPAQAIVFSHSADTNPGVIDQRCYGCGRCLPICPIQQITTRSHISTPDTIGSLILEGQVDALEIHTQTGRLSEFRRLWEAIAPYLPSLKLLAVSCPDGEGLIDYLWDLYNTLSPLPCPLVWQTDGRPMSGDIGDGATRAALKLGQKVLSAGLPGYVQLAGGTNRHTVSKLKALGLLNTLTWGGPAANPLEQKYIAGVAYGSFARTLLLPILDQVAHQQSYCLEEAPDLLKQAVSLAQSLVFQLKVPLMQQLDSNQLIAQVKSSSGLMNTLN